MKEFEMGLLELTEAYIDAEILFNDYMEDITIDDEGYFLSESANEYLTEADLKAAAGGAKQAIGNMVQSFFDFLTGAFQNLCNKLKARPDLKGLASSLQSKASQARQSVTTYWNEVKAIKGEEHTGKFASLKNKISTIIARFKKMCEDAKNKIASAAGKAKDAVKSVPDKVKAAPGKVKASAKATAMKGAEVRAAAAENKGKEPLDAYQRMNKYSK